MKLSLSDLPIVAAVFASPLDPQEHRYVASEMTHDEFRARYADIDYAHDYRLCTPVNMDAGPIRGDLFFMCYCEDCMSPPVAIVKADDIEEAIDMFVETCEWAQMSEEDAAEREADGLGETVGMTGQGVRYDNETIHIRPIQLMRVDVL